jgi:hypothetical protein
MRIRFSMCGRRKKEGMDRVVVTDQVTFGDPGIRPEE